jgi:hypothetical protein
VQSPVIRHGSSDVKARKQSKMLRRDGRECNDGKRHAICSFLTFASFHILGLAPYASKRRASLSVKRNCLIDLSQLAYGIFLLKTLSSAHEFRLESLHPTRLHQLSKRNRSVLT